MAEPLLRVRRLGLTFELPEGEARVLDGVSLDLDRGEILALIGESGSGKSLTALAILGLVPRPGRVDFGELTFQGRDLTQLAPREWCQVRGRRMGLVLQDAEAALDPLLSIEAQLVEPLRCHHGATAHEALAAATRALAEVGLAADILERYPHQLSGGQRQRVLFASVLSLEPELVIADEPTTALDSSLQAEILDLARRRTRERGTSWLWITHDPGLAHALADRAVVLYAGRVCESGPMGELLCAPAHPYTRALWQSEPGRVGRGEPIPTLPGQVPSATRFPSACRFRTRCPKAVDHCATWTPELKPVEGSSGRDVACHFPESSP